MCSLLSSVIGLGLANDVWLFTSFKSEFEFLLPSNSSKLSEAKCSSGNSQKCFVVVFHYFTCNIILGFSIIFIRSCIARKRDAFKSNVNMLVNKIVDLITLYAKVLFVTGPPM